MLFKKSYGELVQNALSYLETNTDITNTSVGGITRSIIEIINRNVADYYDVLDINMAMGFLSTAEGYFLDLIGDLFNVDRIETDQASVTAANEVQRFYVTSGTLHDRIPTDIIPINTKVSTSDGLITYSVTEDTSFGVAATEVYVPITADSVGTESNVPANILTSTTLGVNNVYTNNEAAIVSGTDTESDSNYRYRLSNTTLAAEKANEISIRLAALSVNRVSDVIIKKYARGIGSYDVIVLPIEGIANQALIDAVQNSIDSVQALGIKGTAIAPSIVPVDIEVKIIFTDSAVDTEKTNIRSDIVTAIRTYIVNIPLGGTFVYNEMVQQVMDVSTKIKDMITSCYFFRDEPHFQNNVEIYWDEMFYPNPDSTEAIRAI